MTTVEQLQDSTNNHDEEKKRLKQDWKAKMTQLNQVNIYLLHCSQGKQFFMKNLVFRDEER